MSGIDDVLFIPISKTASSSIRQALGYPIQGLPGHFTARIARSFLGDKEFGRRWKFAVARHPLDRFVSWFHYRPDESPIRWIERRMVRNRHSPRDEMIIRASQTEWLTDGEHPTNPFLGRPDAPLLVDHILRFDHLEEDWELVCEKVGKAIPLPHENKSRRAVSWQEWVTNDVLDLLFRYWGPDFEGKIGEKTGADALKLTDSRT